ncbi:MAG: NAD(P)/FAD-dependent oxidoreductase, partial [Chloroflexota bacterium]
AGRTLQDAGYEVTLLEGRERIGGRTHTDSTLGPHIDLGGSWIHGPHGNPMTALAKQFGATWKWTDFKNLLGNSVMAFDTDGSQIDIDEYTSGINAFDGGLAAAYSSILYEKPGEEAQSMADLYAYGLPNIGELSEAEQKGFFYASVIRLQYEDSGGLEDIGMNVDDEYVKLPGGDNLLCGGGFKRIVEGLSEGLTLKTGCKVERVTFDGEGVTLETSQGTYRADHCIVTVPLGVLKSGMIAFDPPLPEEKSAAIERIGFGNYEKIALKFPKVFWPKEPHRLNYISDHEPPLYNAWLNFAHFTDEPVLVCYHGGPMAEYTNTMDDEELITGCMETLRKMFGDEIPDPVTYVRTSWSKDLFSQGSYSFSKVGQQPNDRDHLAAPIGSHLFFAGEATHPFYHGTVHGAYESGVRAAREVMGDDGVTE